MAKFLTTHGISSHIEKIIIEAQKCLVLVSPFLRISPIFYERLKDVSKRGVSIIVMYGKDELKSGELEKLNSLEKIKLFSSENLHAKCYFNENEMVISSMNMHEFSEKNNREMGILINKEKDEELYNKAFEEAQSICSNSLNVNTHESLKKTQLLAAHQGYCIRCKTEIKVNREQPYCYKCYSIWVQFENPFYEEQYCHRCGSSYSTSKNYPLCNQCFNKYGYE